MEKYNMKQKGFTLIELLAVIVILAIIALIATPVILGIINNVKDESNKRSIEMYAKAIENAVAKHQLTSTDEIIGSFDSQNKGKQLIQEGKSPVEIDYNGNVVCDTIEIYEEGTVYLANCKVDEKTVDYTYGKSNIPNPESFASDSWETISKAVREGNTNVYKVGDTKEISLTDFTNQELDSNGLYTIRIANISNDDEVCISEKNKAGETYSKTACGFVIEFVDIIATHAMNSTPTNVGGYPASSIYKFINDKKDNTITSIYESLPEDLRDVIINTTVVSGYEGGKTENYITIDKLYLLSTKEV